MFYCLSTTYSLKLWSRTHPFCKKIDKQPNRRHFSASYIKRGKKYALGIRIRSLMKFFQNDMPVWFEERDIKKSLCGVVREYGGAPLIPHFSFGFGFGGGISLQTEQALKTNWWWWPQKDLPTCIVFSLHWWWFASSSSSATRRIFLRRPPCWISRESGGYNTPLVIGDQQWLFTPKKCLSTSKFAHSILSSRGK